MKTCSRCKKVYEDSQFEKGDGKVYKRCEVCRATTNELIRKYRESHKEACTKARIANKERINQRAREWYAKNKEHASETFKKYYQKNKEKEASRKKIWYEKNREAILERWKQQRIAKKKGVEME